MAVTGPGPSICSSWQQKKSGSLCSASRSDDPAGPGSSSKTAGTFYKIGIGTFVDPRIEGGRLNKCAKDILAEIIQIDGEEYIHYKSLKPDVAIFRASAADEKGNVVFTEEGLITEALSEAQAVKIMGE